MLILTSVITQITADLYKNPTAEVKAQAKDLYQFLNTLNISALKEGMDFHVEEATDNNGNEYKDVFLRIDSQFTRNGEKFVASGSIAINIQPLLDFLRTVF